MTPFLTQEHCQVGYMNQNKNMGVTVATHISPPKFNFSASKEVNLLGARNAEAGRPGEQTRPEDHSCTKWWRE